jgi:hypothetical protein
MVAGTPMFSTGRDLKKLSIFFAWSFSLCLIQPVIAVLLLIKNHFAPPGACVSASGVAVSPGASVPNRTEASSGAAYIHIALGDSDIELVSLDSE